MLKIVWEKIHENAQIPTYATPKAAGMDVYSPISATIEPRGNLLIKSGLKALIPEGRYLEVASRSGTAVKASIEKGAGTIDEDYRKEIGILLYNHSDRPYYIVAGDRIAQLIVRKYEHVKNVEGEVPDNDRGGFGSTGS